MLLKATPGNVLFGGASALCCYVLRAVLERTIGYNAPYAPGGSHNVSDPFRLFARYRYSYGNQVQYGMTADKDAGEPFLKKEIAEVLTFIPFISIYATSKPSSAWP